VRRAVCVVRVYAVTRAIAVACSVRCGSCVASSMPVMACLAQQHASLLHQTVPVSVFARSTRCDSVWDACVHHSCGAYCA
jgi:hypothetical protein